MKYFFFLLLAAFVFSCHNPVSEKTGTQKDSVDLFRQDVMKLRRAGLLQHLSGQKLDSLIEVYRKDSLNGLKEILSASGDLLDMHVMLNGRTVEEVYKAICDTFGRRFPELKCDEVQSRFLPDQPGGKDTGWVALRVRFGKSWYERKLYYFKHWEIDDFVYRLYNVMLADSGKAERLHLVEFTCENCPQKQDDFMGDMDVSRYGYLMLNKAQEDSLLGIRALQMEPEHEFNVFTGKQVQEELSKLEATGFPQVIGAQWYDEVKSDVQRTSIYNTEDVYEFVDTLFYNASLDTMNDYNPYEDMLHRLSKISRGHFIPTDISDEAASANTRNVRFTFEGDQYAFEAKQEGDMLFPGIFDNVNKALEDHHKGAAFYTVMTKDNACMLVFIEDKQLEKVKASGFFPEVVKGVAPEMKDRYKMQAAK